MKHDLELLPKKT